ncbi:MAG: hypothetical protein JWN87_151 [Frankiales bacterium]|nr:hypothetical protein [Frankiales bacterium]
MNRVVKVLMALVALGALAVGGFAAFEHFDQAEVKKSAHRGCATLDVPTGTPTLPAGLTLPSDQKLLRVDSQGKTVVVFASTAGTLDDVVKVRDAVLDALTGQGYTKGGTDQEPGIEAEGEFAGKAEGTIKVKPLCTDRLEVRYKING